VLLERLPVGPRIAEASVANRRHGYTVEVCERGVGDARCPDVVDFGGMEPSSGRASEETTGIESILVGSGGRYELYSITPL
jgi:hypothetical protein